MGLSEAGYDIYKGTTNSGDGLNHYYVIVYYKCVIVIELLERYMNGLIVILQEDLDVTIIMIMIDEVRIRESPIVLLKVILMILKGNIIKTVRFMQIIFMIN